MNKETQSIVVALLGGLLVSITLSGRFTSYVKPGFAPLLLIGGGILVVVGVLSLVLAILADIKVDRARKQALAAAPAGQAGSALQVQERGGADGGAGGLDHDGTHDHDGMHDHDGTDDHDGTHDHDGTLNHDGMHDHDGTFGHDRGLENDGNGDAYGHDHSSSRAPWLILVPVLVLLLVAPPALGADAVARNASSQGLAGFDVLPREDATSKDGAGGGGGYKFNDGSGSVTDASGSRRTMHFPPLEGADPAITIKDFVLRALYDADNSVQDTPVTVTGFIAPAGDGFTDGYTIARMVISCCAADANPMQLHVGGGAPFPSNTWVEAVVSVVPDTANLDNGYVPTVTVTSVNQVQQPADPYEH